MCLLHPKWKIKFLHTNYGEEGFVYDFLEPWDLPDTFFTIKMKQIKSDIVRINLLDKYGGTHMDPTIHLFKQIDEICMDYLGLDEENP